MDPFWRELIALIVSPVIIVGVVAWLMRTWMQQGFQKELEKFRVELEKEKDESLQRTSLINQKKADVIWHLYSKLESVRHVIDDYEKEVILYRDGVTKEKPNSPFNEIKAIHIYIYKNRIVFTDDLYNRIISFFVVCLEKYESIEKMLNREDFESIARGLFDFDLQIVQLHQELRKAFRNALGIHELC